MSSTLSSINELAGLFDHFMFQPKIWVEFNSFLLLTLFTHLLKLNVTTVDGNTKPQHQYQGAHP